MVGQKFQGLVSLYHGVVSRILFNVEQGSGEGKPVSRAFAPAPASSALHAVYGYGMARCRGNAVHCDGRSVAASIAGLPLRKGISVDSGRFMAEKNLFGNRLTRFCIVTFMPIYGLRFRALGQTSYYSGPPGLSPGVHVLIEAEQGYALAQVVSGPAQHLPKQESEPLPHILRLASPEDVRRGEANEQLSREAQAFCRQCIRQRNLDMKLVDVEVFFDRSKLIFYFTAPSRIDFRDLVKDLVREYRARIELRQIGVRHETQMVGAVGNCGMVCCCRRYLRKFAPVTIRMAKEQNLFLNPAKISGICGRLLCCLSYEQENYDHFHRNCPRLGKKYQTDKGGMKVLRANMFRNSLAVLTEANEELELTLEEWQALSPHRPEAPPSPQGQNKQPPKQLVGDGLLVVSATPDTLEHLDFMDDLFSQDAAGQQDAHRPEHAAGSSHDEPGTDGHGDAAKPRRKRRRKTQKNENQ